MLALSSDQIQKVEKERARKAKDRAERKGKSIYEEREGGGEGAFLHTFLHGLTVWWGNSTLPSRGLWKVKV